MNRRLLSSVFILGLLTAGLLSCEDNSSCPSGMSPVDDGNGSTVCVPDSYSLRN